ncbi:acyl carrier protein [Lacrimispora sp.]|jgi:acyl carrier protein|uniref:acyl carrier protein n=1 Tax=Lacrimispora sp. TaxID=2719234 RepID=UPI0028A92CE9|nr:phosphopantetheine-binding protein [Lacrimispora sp.]
MLNEIMTLATDIFEDDDILPTSRLEEAKRFDSMNLVQFIIELSEAFEMDIEDEEVEKTMTFAELAKRLEEKR